MQRLLRVALAKLHVWGGLQLGADGCNLALERGRDARLGGHGLGKRHVVGLDCLGLALGIGGFELSDLAILGCVLFAQQRGFLFGHCGLLWWWW